VVRELKKTVRITGEIIVDDDTGQGGRRCGHRCRPSQKDRDTRRR